MEKYKLFVLIISLICIPELICLILYHVKYISDFTFESFMNKLQKKLDELGEYDINYYPTFENLFNKYYDTTGLNLMIKFLQSFVVFITIFALLLLTFLLQISCCCKQRDFLRFILSIISLIICFGVSFTYVSFAFKEKYKIEMSEDKIYIFDKDFNQEIKDNLDFMFNRRIYLIVCPFFLQACLIAQIIFIVIKDKLIKKDNNYTDNFNKDIGVAPIEENLNN